MALEKVNIINLDNEERFVALFNPTQYTVTKTTDWTFDKVPGTDTPKASFGGGGQRTLQVELFFDVYEFPRGRRDQSNGNVAYYIDKLWELVMINPSKKNAQTQRSRPPMVQFEWGSHWQFKAVITNMTVNYTMFRQDGTPVRATVNMTLNEVSGTEEARQNPTSGSLPGYRRREVRPHDTLPLIAFEEYGDNTKWRLIAEANDLDDPMNLRAGTVLAIPPASR